MKLSKHRTVAVKDEYFAKRPYVNFVTWDDDDEDEVRELFSITRQNYENFGEPDKITVTIEPGDKLNGEANV